jgi:UDP-N-acetylmuramoylalanine--D-glutamate ligase
VSKDGSFRGRPEDPRGKHILVVGFARSGRAALDFFRRRGAVATVSDSRPPWTFAREIPELLAGKVGLEFGEHGLETFLRQDVIVVSPGVPWDLAPLVAARRQGIPVMPEVEAAGCFLKGTLVGVTGSNGKTTTTSLIGRMLDVSGFPTLVGGNIGSPLIGMTEETTPDTVTVAELSSFQLEGIEQLHPRVAVLLNITGNHLDRHPSFEAYVEAKVRIFRNQTGTDYAVLNADDPAVMGVAERIAAHKVFFSRTADLPEGLLVSRGRVLYRLGHLERELFSVRDVKLRGEFNLENVLAASAAACVLGADFDALAQAVREFLGVEHRLEPVGEVLGVEFYNDSKATSVDATVKALTAFPRGVHLILGGKDKGAPYAPLIPLLKERVREVLVIGAAADRIARELAGTVELVQAGDLGTAVCRAFGAARPGDVVLLSPACSSYDQFHDFEERGRVFKDLVEGLARVAEAAREQDVRFELEAPLDSQAVGIEVAPASDEFTRASGPAAVPEPPVLLAGNTAAIEAPEPSGAAPAMTEERPRAEAVESSAISPAGNAIAGGAPSETEAPAPSRPERIYIYELDAEELPPLDIEPDIQLEEPALPVGTTPGSDAVFQGKYQPFLFEIPAFSPGLEASPPEASQGEVRAEPAARPAPARRSRKKRVKETREEPSGDDDKGGKDGGKPPDM